MLKPAVSVRLFSDQKIWVSDVASSSDCVQQRECATQQKGKIQFILRNPTHLKIEIQEKYIFTLQSHIFTDAWWSRNSWAVYVLFHHKASDSLRYKVQPEHSGFSTLHLRPLSSGQWIQLVMFTSDNPFKGTCPWGGMTPSNTKDSHGQFSQLDVIFIVKVLTHYTKHETFESGLLKS